MGNMDAEFTNAEKSISQSLRQLQSTVNKEIESLTSSIEDVRAKQATAVADTQKELEKVRKESEVWRKKYEDAESKLKRIEGQLAETAKKLEEMSTEKGKEIDMLELLDVYLGLVNNVFDGRSHVRLLVMLHGDKEEFTINELIAGSGIGGIEVRKAIFDLRNVGIVEVNEETEKVRLLQRFIN